MNIRYNTTTEFTNLQIRLWRYGLGIIFLILGVSSYICLDLLKGKIWMESIGGTTLLLGLIFSLIYSLAWSAILIGRCETFIKNKEYLK